MIPNISAKIWILRSLKRIEPFDTLKLFYKAIILSHFDYSDMVYNSDSEISKLRLKKLQTRVAKLISGSGPRESRNGLAPEYLTELFSSNDTVHMYNTGNTFQLRAATIRIAHYQSSFTVYGSNLWNDLPSNIKKLSSSSSFKAL